MRNARCFVTPMAILLATASAQAQLHADTFDVSLMPSAQGWGYYPLNSGLTEAQVYATNGTVLTSNTMGNGYQGQGANFVYDAAATGSFTANLDWIVEARVRVLQGELWSFHYGFSIGAHFDNMAASVGIMPSTWQDHSLNGGGRDNTQWTLWRVETDRANGVFRVFADGNLLATRALSVGPVSGPYPDHYYFLGDATGGANAHAEVSSWSFRQVPAPGVLGVVGVAGLLTARRRR